jgi:N-acetylglucosamine-6-phosphate deacetylase
MTRDALLLEGHVVTPDGIVRGRIEVDETVRAVTPTEGAPERWILPGFIDVHVHGGGGADTMDGAEGVRALARFHARHGTTSLLPTTVTAAWPAVLAAVKGVAEAMANPDRGGADVLGAAVLGAHVEGPFVSPLRLGAQPPFDRDAEAGLVDELIGTGVVRLVTVAPERSGVPEAAARFAEHGVRIGIGHTAASYEEVRAFGSLVRSRGGVLGFTHLFNAMGGMQGRQPGVVGAALADGAAFAEVILDGHHVHAGSALAAWRAISPRLLLVSDAIRATGTDAETSELGGRPISIEGGAARTAEGALAGSLLTLDQALRRAVSMGIPVEAASHMASGAPAAYLGLRDRGTLVVGARADVVVLDRDLQVQEVYVAGRRLDA